MNLWQCDQHRLLRWSLVSIYAHRRSSLDSILQGLGGQHSGFLHGNKFIHFGRVVSASLALDSATLCCKWHHCGMPVLCYLPR